MNYGLDFSAGTFTGGQIRLKNDSYVIGRNSGDTANANLFKFNTLSEFQIDVTTRLNSLIIVGNGANLQFSTSTGTKIGTTTGQKIGFWNATPVVQPTNTTDLRQALIDLGLLATGGATPLNLNGGALTVGGATADTALTVADVTVVATVFDRALMAATMWNPPDGEINTLRVVITGKGTTDVTDRGASLKLLAQDHASVANVAITGAANNGSGLIRITAAAHGLATSDKVVVYGVGGTAEANGKWTVTVITTSTFDLQGSTFTNAYTSGGTVTNRPLLYGLHVQVAPRVARGGLTGAVANADDVDGIAIQNAGTAKATEAVYVAASPSIAAQAWYATFNTDAKTDIGLKVGGTVYEAAVDLAGTTTQTVYNGSAVPLRLPNAKSVVARNAANSADVALFQINTSNWFEIQTTTKFADGVVLVLGTGTGTKFGNATSEKIAFHGSTPVIQRVGASQAAAATTGSTSTTPFGYTTAAQADAIVTLVNEIRATLVEKGLMKGAA